VGGRSHHLLRGRAKSRPKAWYERGTGIARLAHDQQLVARAYPTLSHRIDDEAGRVYLEGVLIYRADCGIPTEIEVRFDFLFDYPDSEPSAFDAGDHFEHTVDRHFSTKTGCCCLWLPPKSRWEPLDPNALIPFLDEVVVFFDRQLVYDAGGQVAWPGGQYGHYGDGYKEWVVEEFGGDPGAVTPFVPVLVGGVKIGRNDPCPCGIGRKFKRCHEGLIDRIRREVSHTRLRSLFL
jgi:hypothetical protein